MNLKTYKLPLIILQENFLGVLFSIPVEVDMFTDQVVGKIAEAISVHIEDDIEISHRIRPAEARREASPGEIC